MSLKTSLSTCKQHIHKLTRDQRRVLRANPEIANKIVNASINANRSFRCSQCNLLMLESPFKAVCSDECRAKAKGHFLGKKRPEHSALMKVKVKELIEDGKFWNAEHRANNLKHLESVNASLTKEARSSGRRSNDSKRRQLKSALARDFAYKHSVHFKRSPLSNLSADDVDMMSIAKIRRCMTEINAIKSAHAMDVNPNMGATQFYKRITVKNLTKCVRRKTVVVRSSLEYNFVKWLEEHADKWVYEWHRIRYTDSGNTYAPDFKIKLGAETWIVETKGFYGSAEAFRKEVKKMTVCAAWARDRGYKFTLLSESSIGKRGGKVDQSTWTDLCNLSDRKLVKFMKSSIPGGQKYANH